MPLIYHITKDMFDIENAADFCTNLVNLMGVSGKGIALEMRKRCPSHIPKYQEACRTKELRIGTIQIIDETEQEWGVINLPTKKHYANDSELEDIARSLEALKEQLLTDKYRYASVILPIPGSGNGGKAYEEVLPLIKDYLTNIEAPIFVCMSPDRTEFRPKYLTIVGPSDYGHTEKEQASIDWVIEKSLEKWGAALDSYEGIVSGGYPGVDRYVCGEYFQKKIEDTYVFKKTGKTPLVVKPNVIRNGVSAGRKQDIALCEIGHDVILFKPNGHNNNRLTSMQIYLENDTIEKNIKGEAPKRIAIFGDRTTITTKEEVIIPVGQNDWEN